MTTGSGQSGDALLLRWVMAYFQDTDDLVFVKDRSLRYVGASRPFAKMLGLAGPEAVVGHTDFELFADQALARRYTEDDRHMIDSGRPLEPYREPLPDKDGAAAWSLTRKGLIYGPSGEVVGVYGIGTDITEQVHAEEGYRLLESKNQEYEGALQALRQTVKTDSLTQLLNHGSTLSAMRDYLNGEGSGGSHALFLIDIDNFKAANDQFGHQRGDAVLIDLAHTVSAIFRKVDIVGRVGGDEFLILMKNVPSLDAVRAKAHELLSALRFSIRSESAAVRLSCSIGIRLTSGDKTLEELFHDADAALFSAKDSGKNCCALWGEPCEILDGSNETHSPVSETAHGISRRRQILIADDDKYSLRLLQRVLERDYAVETAVNGAQALEKLRQSGQFSLLITDIQMPVMDGWELLTAMQGEDALRGMPVIVITADDHSESEVKALNLGATDVIVKPFVAATLLSRVQNTIARREARLMEEQNRLYALRIEQQETLLRMAELDDLTGLLNRRAFVKQAEELIRLREPGTLVISSLNVNSFKVINDRFGHGEGDRLLKYLAEKVIGVVTEAGYLACRDVADGFVTLLPNDHALLERVSARQQALLAQYTLPMRISVRIGRYAIVEPELDVNLMLDRAMLAEKSVSGNARISVAWYTEAMREKMIREKELTDEMHPALAEGQFEVWFQPQYDYVERQMSGAEALVRWRHPSKGLISPGEFIPFFEKNGFIYDLDKYVWEESCRYIRKWLDTYHRLVPISVSVNISRIDVSDPHLVEYLVSLTEKYGLEPKSLRLEITESAYMDNPRQLIEVVKKLHSVGFVVEMDDFGSGFSSLNTLKDVPVDVLKLDVRFMSAGVDDTRGSSILSAIIRMAHSINLKVIAEGVEDQVHAEYLRRLECRYMQGYYFSKPLPAPEFEQLLTSES